MTPAYEIFIEDENITSRFQDRLISLNISLQSNGTSDECRIIVEDSQKKLSVPDKGILLNIQMGYTGKLWQMGSFIVDSIRLKGTPDSVEIVANSGAFVNNPIYAAIGSYKDRSWGTITLGELVKAIALEDKLDYKISPDLSGETLKDAHQTKESDFNFLHRNVRNKDGYTKIQSGVIIVSKNATTLTAGTGSQMPIFTITPNMVSEWDVLLSDTHKFKMASADWHDFNTATRKRETAGSGTPTYICPLLYPSQEEAQAAAEGGLTNFSRRGNQLTLTMPGKTEITPECQLVLSGFRDGVDGQWASKQVEHSLSRSGFTTKIIAETLQQ